MGACARPSIVSFLGEWGLLTSSTSISDVTLLPQLKPGRCPPESQEAPSGSPGWHLLTTEHRGLHLAQGCTGDLVLDARSPSAHPKAGGRGWPADTVPCCPRRLGSQQSRPEEMSSNSGEPRTG